METFVTLERLESVSVYLDVQKSAALAPFCCKSFVQQRSAR
jgi:hypothetical protein